jgi:hypothetical protein
MPQTDKGDSMENKKIYVFVKNFAWTNEDVEIYRTSKEAELAFQQYTGFAYNDNYFDQDNKEYNEKFSETKIYEIELPHFLEYRNAVKEKGGI